jgi:O-antigen ligase
MANSAVRGRGADAAPVNWLIPVAGVFLALGGAVVLGPQGMVSALIASVGIIVIGVRPHWGVAIIMTLLMVQYGSRRYERTGIAGYIESLIPAGTGLLTINNVLGIFLLLLLVYHLYRDGDWSFLQNRQLQLVVLLTLVLLASGTWNAVDYQEQAELGLRIRGQDPMRLMISRGLFLMLFVFFVSGPKEIRLIAGIFVALAFLTAWSGSSAAITGGARSEVAEYRGGGLAVLIEAAQNPNRLAMFATLGLIFIWEYLEGNRLVRYRWFAFAGALLMVVTVFLSASRGGLVGLAVASALLFVRRRQGARSLVYGAAALVVAAMLISQVVPPESLERITNLPGFTASGELEGSGSIERRQYTYGIGLKIWSEAPLLGIGLGNWSYKRFLIDPARSAAAPHNAYLKVLAEGGIVTLFLYLALFYVTLRQLNAIIHHPGAIAWARAEGVEWLVHATRIGILTFLVFSLFADLFDLIFFYLLIGLAGSLIRRYYAGDRAMAATA